MESSTLQIPPMFYYVAGIIIVTNLGTIFSIIYAALKAAWWLSKLDSRVTEAQKSAIDAHKRLNKLEGVRL